MVVKSEYAHGEFSWVDLSSHGLADAGAFYSEVFGWKVVEQDTKGGPPYAQLELDGATIGGLGELNDEMQGMGIPPMWNSYVNVDDIHAVTAKAEELGATITVPVMQVLESGWLSFILDNSGASLAFWQKGDQRGATKIGEPGSFCWNELTTKDIVQSREFYAALLGWDFADHAGAPAKYFIIKDGDHDRGGLMQMTEEWGDVPAHWGVYFAVENADDTVERARAAGGVVRVPPFDTEVGQVAILADTQGAGFSIIEKSSV